MPQTIILSKTTLRSRLKQLFCKHSWNKWGKNQMAENGAHGEPRFRTCSKCSHTQILVTITHEMDAFFREHGRDSFDVAKRMVDEDRPGE